MMIFLNQPWVAYHLAKKSGNFGLKSNGMVIFRKFRSEIVEYLWRYSTYFRMNFHREIPYHFKKFPFPVPFTSTERDGMPVSKMVSAISSTWSAFSENHLPLHVCNSHTNRNFPTNGKHPWRQMCALLILLFVKTN